MATRRSIKCAVEPCRFRGRDAVKKNEASSHPAASFHACFVFALLREIVFRHGKDDAIAARLEDDLARALERQRVSS